MPATRGVKRAASKTTTSSASSGPKNKKKRTPFQLEIPTAPKKRGRVLACGQGDVGQLGLGENVLETSKFKQVTGLGDKIVDVCAGGMHTVALDANGKVWTYGCNDEGALGRATSGEKDEGTPKTVSLPSKAVMVTAGDSHSAALMENGDVYAWGAFRDSHGSMGLVVRGREGKSCRDPVKVDIGETAAAIASGGDHLAILSTTGAVYTMGCGEQGQLGRLTQRSASRESRQGFSALLVPSKVNIKRLISRVWAGSHATFVLDANTDKVYAFGLNNYGQLGITGEKRRTAIYVPIECDAFSAVADASWRSVAVGQHHSLALDAQGHVYAVGRCEYGRLGLGDRTGDAEALEPIPALQNKKCVSIATGTSSSFAVTDTGEVWSWGMGSEGQLGTGRCDDELSPTLATLTQAEGCTPRHISAGGQHTVLLAEDPASKKEDTPPPEMEMAEEKPEENSEVKSEEEEEVEEEEKPKRKRKKQEKEEEGEATTSAEKSEDEKPQKINGDEKKETPMEVDETDKPDEQKPIEAQTEKPSEPTPDQTADKTDTPDEKPDTDTSSQDSQASQDNLTSQESQDVEMQDKSDKTVNGTPEEEKIEAKSVEGLLQTANPITTTA